MKLTKIESYEIQAFAFRVMTGYVAPGKDVSPMAYEAPYEERCAAWDEWRNKHAHCILAMLHGFEALIDRDDEPTGAMLDRLDATERESELLREDAERLDWLEAQINERGMCSVCHGVILASEPTLWVSGFECHSRCYPPRPADPAYDPTRLLTEDDVRRIVREELAKEQR